MNKIFNIILLLPIWLTTLQSPSLGSEKAVVNVVLFYSPNCGHCHLIITETLPPLFELYDDQLNIVGVDVTNPIGQELFIAALKYFDLDSGGVPLLVVGENYLVGSLDIPNQLPGLIEHYLAQGGVDWPAIPGLVEALSTPRPSDVPDTETSPEATISRTPESTTPTDPIGITMTDDNSDNLTTKFARDPLGNILAVFVLATMVLSVGMAAIVIQRTPTAGSVRRSGKASVDWTIPILCLIGLGVAGYLAYVETTQVEAVCGPVGDCNTVQQSQYARLFGFLPIGILGLIGYVTILLSWLVGRNARQPLSTYTALATLGLTAFGVLFSIYLTFLEPFIIGATCAWCLTSAVIMTIIFWLSIPPARLALNKLKASRKV